MPVYNLCRICLTEDTDTKVMQQLFGKDARCAEIVQQIKECSGIALKAHEELPKMICLHCLDTLETSHNFRKMCQASEHALLDSFIKSESELQDVATDTTDAEQLDSHGDILFDFRTEFIDAHEVELNEIADNHGESTHEFLSDSDSEFITNDDKLDCGVESAIIDEYEYLDEEHIEDDEVESVTVKQEFKVEPNEVCEIVERQPIKKRKKTVGKRVYKKPGVAKAARGRKKIVDEPASIMCEICGNTYAKRGLLNMHMLRHLADKPYECEICGKKFASSSELGRHIRVHTGEKPYKCRFCDRTFSHRGANIKHERIHTNERPFSCNTCGKTFTYSDVLKNHMLTHTGEKPFPCIPCDKTFARKHQLQQHLSTITHQQTVKNLASVGLSSAAKQ